MIEKVQRLFTRNVFARCFKYVYPIMPSYAERLQILSLQSLEEHRLKNELILFHKIVCNEIAIQTQNPIFSDFHITRTNPRGIIIPTSKKDIRREFFFARIAQLYLKLPNELINLPVNSFSAKIKGFKLDQAVSGILNGDR